MKRPLAVAGFVVGVVVTLVALLYLDTPTAQQPATSEPSAAHSSVPASTYARWAPRLTRSGAPTWLPREKQPGESDVHHRTRLYVVDAYAAFLAEANLSEDQERAVMALLADAQANSKALHTEVMERAKETGALPGRTSAAERARSRDAIMSTYTAMVQEHHEQLTQILRPDQVAVFYKHCPSILMVADAAPFDLP